MRLREGLDDECPVAMYAAALTGDAIIAGAWQRAQDALVPNALSEATVLRRSTGGIGVRGGDGIIYLALALLDASSLMRCPPRAILNRNVRGVLQGLRAAGMETNYFGRDYLTFGILPGVYVGWARNTEGHVLLEFFIAQRRDFCIPAEFMGYPPPPEPAFRGRLPTYLTALDSRPWRSDDIITAIVDSHAKQFDLEWRSSPPAEVAPDDALRSCRLRVREDELVWSPPRPEAIGFLSAGVALDARGAVADVRLAGDFMQSDASEQLLSERARGQQLDDAGWVDLVNGVYADDAHFIEGIRDISSILAAIREATQGP